MNIPFLSFFKKPLDTVSEEMTSKFKTPFFTSYIFVWIIRNNLFLYNLFFNSKIDDKTDLLKSQFNFSELSFYKESVKSIVIALLVMLIFYFVINLSRIITIFSEERIKLNLLDKLKSKTIGSIDEVDFWKNRSDDLNVMNRKLEEDVQILRTSENFYKNEFDNTKKEFDKAVKFSDNIIRKIEGVYFKGYTRSIRTILFTFYTYIAF